LLIANPYSLFIQMQLKSSLSLVMKNGNV